jgi:hypothetical protein
MNQSGVGVLAPFLVVGAYPNVCTAITSGPYVIFQSADFLAPFLQPHSDTKMDRIHNTHRSYVCRGTCQVQPEMGLIAM